MRVLLLTLLFAAGCNQHECLSYAAGVDDGEAFADSCEVVSRMPYPPDCSPEDKAYDPEDDYLQGVYDGYCTRHTERVDVGSNGCGSEGSFACRNASWAE